MTPSRHNNRPHNRLAAALCIGVLCATAPSAAAQHPVRIYPLGDSILESSAGRPTPRYFLDHLLHDNGFDDFDFVGHNVGAFAGPPSPSDFDQDHEAYSGWRVDHHLLDLQQNALESQPDVALIHLGTNDKLAGQSDQSTIAELGQMIDVLRGVNPYVTVVLSQIIPIAFVDVVPLNAQIAQLAQSRDLPHARVLVVDHYSAIDTATDMYFDGIHPNDSGEMAMAQAWFDLLSTQVLAPTPQSAQTVGIGCGPSGAAPSARLVAGQAPFVGNSFTLALSGAPSDTQAFGFFDVNDSDYLGTPLPIDLGAVGSPGCILRVGPTVVVPLGSTGVAGTVAWTVAIPDEPGLAGVPFFEQVVVVAPGANPLGLIVSEAITGVILPGSS